MISIEIEEALRSILTSPWSAEPNLAVRSYYLQNQRPPKRYALYSLSMDRFLLVDSLDLWSIEYAAKLLSSKMSTVICIFSSEEPKFENENCLLWSFEDKKAMLSQAQTPTLRIIQDNSELVLLGPPTDFANNLSKLVKEQEFALFILRATYAMRLVDLRLTLHPDFIINDDQKFYTNILADSLQNYSLTSTSPYAAWQQGFLTKMSSILYTAVDIEGALMQINEAYKVLPSDTYQVSYTKNICLKLFYELLGMELAK